MDTDMDKSLSEKTVPAMPGEVAEYSFCVISEIVAAQRL